MISVGARSAALVVCKHATDRIAGARRACQFGGSTSAARPKARSLWLAELPEGSVWVGTSEAQDEVARAIIVDGKPRNPTESIGVYRG
jgi:hypothetical protein